MTQQRPNQVSEESMAEVQSWAKTQARILSLQIKKNVPPLQQTRKVTFKQILMPVMVMKKILQLRASKKASHQQLEAKEVMQE